MNESETRAELITPQLKEAGWTTGGDVRVHREHPISDGKIYANGKRGRKIKADYVLAYKNVKLAAVEAKKKALNAREGVTQAKLYAEKLHLPFSFATNGKAIYQINHLTGDEGNVDSFPTPEQLWQLAGAKSNDWLNRFNAVPFHDAKPLRYYQEIAANHVLRAMADGKKRALLTLATGTGKTLIAAQTAWKLFNSRWTLQQDHKRQPRILFLADRNILADQAFLNFSFFADDALVRIRPEDIARRGGVPTNGNIFFTIFQTFMSGANNTPYFGEYEPDFFDLVIIDECHRGGANDESTWRSILDHFSAAVHLGLTATPKREDNANTYEYFGDPVFIYSLQDGIQDGFLTPFKIKRIQSNIDDYAYESDDKIIEGKINENRTYTESEFNWSIEIEERERKRVQDMLKIINPQEKTIVFCANQGHAALVRDLINQASPSSRVDYCVRVSANDGQIGENYLKQFQDNEKTIPTILTTSHKLSTGVDARNIRNIVLMRSIKSMIEFKQIIGRGTRLYEGKNYFTIIDFVNAYTLFSDPEWDGQSENHEEDDNGNGGGGGGGGGGDDREPRQTLRIKLGKQRVLNLSSTPSTYFYLDGKPVAAEEFVQHLFGIITLPEILGNETELRKVWAEPSTRKALLQRLEEHDCGRDSLNSLQELMAAENSDLYDVLEYIAKDTPPLTRIARAMNGKRGIYTKLSENQQQFIDFVLQNYTKNGIDELDADKLSIVLNAKYGSIDEALKHLGNIKEIRQIFIEFQQDLYKAAQSALCFCRS